MHLQASDFYIAVIALKNKKVFGALYRLTCLRNTAKMRPENIQNVLVNKNSDFANI